MATIECSTKVLKLDSPCKVCLSNVFTGQSCPYWCINWMNVDLVLRTTCCMAQLCKSQPFEVEKCHTYNCMSKFFMIRPDYLLSLALHSRPGDGNQQTLQTVQMVLEAVVSIKGFPKRFCLCLNVSNYVNVFCAAPLKTNLRVC